MGLMNWFLPSRRSLACAQIEGGLQAWKRHGFFDGDPVASAKAVEHFSAPRLPKAMMDGINPSLLAVIWLVTFISGTRAERDQLLPFANVGLGLLRAATEPDSKLAPWEQNIAQRALVELSAFVDASNINLNLHTGEAQRDAVPIDGSNSMACIIAERSYLDNRYGVGGWHMVSQASIEEAGRFYDKLTIRLTKGGETIIWFDLTASKAKWTDEGNIEALRQFQKASSKVVNDSKLNAAKKIILDCLGALNYSTEQQELNAYFPTTETVEDLISHAINENLTPEELALLLIDAGFVDHNAALKKFESIFIAANYHALGERAKDVAQSSRAERLERHDKLLTEIFKRAVEKGTLLVPQYGSVGVAMKNALGTLMEPSISPEKHKINSETPRDRDRAMTELINRMKN